MSRAQRQALVDRADPQPSIVRQCQLLKVAALDAVLSAGTGERR